MNRTDHHDATLFKRELYLIRYLIANITIFCEKNIRMTRELIKRILEDIKTPCNIDTLSIFKFTFKFDFSE